MHCKQLFMLHLLDISSIITARNGVRQGNVFTRVYDSVQGGSLSQHATQVT